MAQIVKNPPAMQETQVRSLGQKGPLEEGMATPSVVATRSGKQTHSGQCRQWSAVYYTSEPKAESPLSPGPRPVFVKTYVP